MVSTKSAGSRVGGVMTAVPGVDHVIRATRGHHGGCYAEQGQGSYGALHDVNRHHRG